MRHGRFETFVAFNYLQSPPNWPTAFTEKGLFQSPNAIYHGQQPLNLNRKNALLRDQCRIFSVLLNKFDDSNYNKVFRVQHWRSNPVIIHQRLNPLRFELSGTPPPPPTSRLRDPFAFPQKMSHEQTLGKKFPDNRSPDKIPGKKE